MCYHCCVLWITPVGLNQARTQSHSTVTLLGWTQAPPYHNNTSLYCSSAVIPCSHSLSWSLFYELATKYSCTVNCTYIALVQHGIQAGLFYHLQKWQNTEWRHSQIKPFSLLFSGDRVKYVGASLVVEADNRDLLKAMLSSFWFCGPHLFWNPSHCYSLDLSIPHIIGVSFY